MDSLEGLSLIRLSGDFDVASFDCSDPDLNEFLVEDALSYQDDFLANTTLMLRDSQVVTYFSLASDAIQLRPGEKEECSIDVPFSVFPALKIARLATDSRFRRLGFGTMALEFCVGLARHLNDPHRHDGIGCRFVTVDAYEGSADFYRRFGFVDNLAKASKNRQTISLRLDVMPYED